MLPTKTTAAQNAVAFSYDEVRGLYFMAVIFVKSIVPQSPWLRNPQKDLDKVYNTNRFTMKHSNKHSFVFYPYVCYIISTMI